MIAEREPSKPYPTRAHYPPVEPVICPNGPLLYPTVDDLRDLRAGHAYRKVDGVWTCRNCQEPRP